jgi:hypothetical protein
MINSSSPESSPGSSVSEDEAVDAIVRSGPGGAIAVAGIATAIVVALWFAFYLFVFLPRSV